MSVVFNLTAAQIVQFLLAIVLPLLVGLVTTKDTSANRKAILLALFSVISVFLTSLLGAIQSGQVFNLGADLMTLVGSFIVSVGMHFGLWKPTGAAGAVQAVGSGRVVEAAPTSVVDQPQP